MASPDHVTAFARQVADAAAISGAGGMAVVSFPGPMRHVIAAQPDPLVALLAVLAVSALVGVSVAVVAGACPPDPSRGD